MRFFMGYIVVGAIMGYIYFYLVKFTATFGWKVSWIWYYTGICAVFMQFVFYDPLIATIHWLFVTKCKAKKLKKCGRRWQKLRSMG
jgi:hypothetical protein